MLARPVLFSFAGLMLLLAQTAVATSNPYGQYKHSENAAAHELTGHEIAERFYVNENQALLNCFTNITQAIPVWDKTGIHNIPINRELRSDLEKVLGKTISANTTATIWFGPRVKGGSADVGVWMLLTDGPNHREAADPIFFSIPEQRLDFKVLGANLPKTFGIRVVDKARSGVRLQLTATRHYLEETRQIRRVRPFSVNPFPMVFTAEAEAGGTGGILGTPESSETFRASLRAQIHEQFSRLDERASLQQARRKHLEAELRDLDRELRTTSADLKILRNNPSAQRQKDKIDLGRLESDVSRAQHRVQLIRDELAQSDRELIEASLKRCEDLVKTIYPSEFAEVRKTLDQIFAKRSSRPMTTKRSTGLSD